MRTRVQSPKTHTKLGILACTCNSSVPRTRWGMQTEEFLKAHRSVSQPGVQSSDPRDPISNTVEGEQGYQRLSSDFHMCSMASMKTYTYTPTYPAHHTHSNMKSMGGVLLTFSSHCLIHHRNDLKRKD